MNSVILNSRSFEKLLSITVKIAPTPNALPEKDRDRQKHGSQRLEIRQAPMARRRR